MELLLQAFHINDPDVEYLLVRFEKFCDHKFHLEKQLLVEKMKHAPFTPKIVYRVLGRHNVACSIMLYGDAEERMEYIKHCTGYKSSSIKDRLEHTIELCVLEGPLREAKELVQVLSMEKSHLLTDVLQLYEIINICFFDKTSSQNKAHDWLVNYIREKVYSFSSGFQSPFNFASLEESTKDLLFDIRAMVYSTDVSRVMPKAIILKGKNSEHDEEDLPVTPFNMFTLYCETKSARTRILTTYESL